MTHFIKVDITGLAIGFLEFCGAGSQAFANKIKASIEVPEGGVINTRLLAEAWKTHEATSKHFWDDIINHLKGEENNNV